MTAEQYAAAKQLAIRVMQMLTILCKRPVATEQEAPR